MFPSRTGRRSSAIVETKLDGCITHQGSHYANTVCRTTLIAIGVGLITRIGFAYLVATSPTERLGQSMGSAEVGRELGDAGGPLLVGALATVITLTPALLSFAGLVTATAALLATPTSRPQHPPDADPVD